MKIHHIGYLVKNIDKAEQQFVLLGFEREGNITYDPIRDIDILFMTNEDYRIELVAPKGKESVVADTLKKTGASPYHICYYCDDIVAAQKDFSKKGFSLVSEIQPANAIEGRNVCFLYNRHVGIVELVEWDIINERK